MKLIAKLIIKGNIEAVTGLHIGGSKSSLDIGGVDLNVIKTHEGVPFIPGSSLKGKLRSLLARIEGSQGVSRKQSKGANHTDEDVPYIMSIFGMAGDDTDENSDKQEISRLIVRDAALNKGHSPDQETYSEMDFAYTDVKFENTIDRKRGVAQHPRQLERVPPGASFDFEMIFDVYDQDESELYVAKDEHETLQNESGRKKRDHYLYALGIAMQLLQDDYLGGQGTRGYGKVRFTNLSVTQKRMQKYRYQVAELDEELQAFQSQVTELV